MNIETSQNSEQQNGPPHFLRKVLIKTLLFFIMCNVSFAFSNAAEWLGNLSAYNVILPGRERLPWSENPKIAYSLSLNNLDAMFASHVISDSKKPENEFRVIVIGDSSTWGFLLPVEDTLTANINRSGLITAAGQQVKAYNLGYPTISLTKDLLLLDYAMRYEPDMILWLVTLEAFPSNKQVFTSLVQNNPQPVTNLIDTYDLSLDPNDVEFIHPTFWGNTIVGQRRPLANLLRLQLYGVMWAATGIDQDISEDYKLRQMDFEIDDSFYNFIAPDLSIDLLAFDVLAAGIQLAGNVPVLLINEPIFISAGENSDIRYNFLYPRWAYDSYRRLLSEYSMANSWFYLDLWDAIPSNEFTNTAIHITPLGTAQFSALLEQAIINKANGDSTGSNGATD